MRTVVAPLAPEVEGQLAGLDGQLRAVAEGYIARLRLEPYLGRLVPRGLLSELEARAVLFARDSRPELMLSEHRGQLRTAGEECSKGQPWRVIYVAREAAKADVRVIVVLAVGLGHADTGQESAYTAARGLAPRLLGNKTSERRKR